LGIAVRAGLHTGEVEVRGEVMSGGAIDFAQKIADHAAAGDILVSSTVKDLVSGSGIGFIDRGTFPGIADEWRGFVVDAVSAR
jgi:class 3 adenylate cyclase